MFNKKLDEQPLYPIQDSDDILYQAPPIPNEDQIYSNNTPNTINTTLHPQNYIPIPNTTSQIINKPMLSNQYIQKSLGASSYFEFAELLEDLAEVKKASVSKYFKDGTCTGWDTIKYRVSIINKDGSSRYIFICKREDKFTPFCFGYIYNVKMKYIPRDSTDAILDTKDFDKRLLDLISNC